MKTILVIIALGAVLVGGVFLLQGPSGQSSQSDGTATAPSTGSRQRDTLPQVTVATSDGASVAVNDLVKDEQVLVINSWATWCPFCVEELPDFVALQEEFGDTIAVVAINRRESPAATTLYLEDLNVATALTYLYDRSDQWYRSIGGFSMPETLFVNARGEIVVHKRGFMRLDEMRENVRTTLTSNEETL